MEIKEYIGVMDQGVETWNEWRKGMPKSVANLLDLRGAVFSDRDLRRFDFSFADLTDAKFRGSNLCDANFTSAKLAEADFLEANLQDASFWGADLAEASLSYANIIGTWFVGANLSGAEVADVKWDRNAMRSRYWGIRGAESCHGNALFRRDALDQDFIDTLERKWGGTWRHKILFRAWGYLDYGRSLSRVVLLAMASFVLFGLLFSIPGLVDYSKSANTIFSPFYYSIVTFTTLGYGDISPKSLFGEILASIEVILGYFTLGLLLAVLAEKIARRS